MSLVDTGAAGSCPVCDTPGGNCGHDDPHPMVFSRVADKADATWQPAPHDLWERYLTINRKDWSTRLVCRKGAPVSPTTYQRCLSNPDGLDDSAEQARLQG